MIVFNKFNRICSSIAIKHFKVGDIVELINNQDFPEGQVGEKYKVSKIYKNNGFERMFVMKKDVCGRSYALFAHRFKKIESK